MTRVATPAGFGYPWYVRLILRLQRRKYGAELAPARLWGRMPRTFLWLTLLYRSIDRARSPIEPELVPAHGFCGRAEDRADHG